MTNAVGTASGGNISINSATFIALENSDTTANAENGLGGNVMINTQGLFRSEDSDITATSNLGPQFSGVVEINTPETDPSDGLMSLPESPVSVGTLDRRWCTN